MKNLVVLVVLFFAGMANAQISVNGGASMLVGFSNPGPWGGVHVGLEVPRDDAVSIYGRFTHHFRRTIGDSIPAFIIAKDPLTVPFSQTVNSIPSMNYNIIEGGTRYYLGNGFDYGFAAYGGSCIMLIFNSVKGDYDTFDETLYELDEFSRYKTTFFSLGFGLGGGVKYSSGRFGTFYFDLNLAYMIFAQSSNENIPGSVGDIYNPLIFNFNLGWRKDILW